MNTSSPKEWIVQRDPPPSILEDIYRLRVKAWQARQPHFAAGITSWRDPFDALAEHFFVRSNERVIAAARLSIHACLAHGPDSEIYAKMKLPIMAPICILSRLVVCPSHARQGLPLSLDLARIDRARDAGCNSVVAATNSGQIRGAQLEALGFQKLCEAYRQASGPLEDTPPPSIFFLSLNRPLAD